MIQKKTYFPLRFMVTSNIPLLINVMPLKRHLAWPPCVSFGACVWYFYSLSRVTPATSHLDALDKDTKLKIVEL